MNNKENEDKKIDSNINKQMIKYDNKGSPYSELDLFIPLTMEYYYIPDEESF